MLGRAGKNYSLQFHNLPSVIRLSVSKTLEGTMTRVRKQVAQQSHLMGHKWPHMMCRARALTFKNILTFEVRRNSPVGQYGREVFSFPSCDPFPRVSW